jgi:hypothetical protein
MVAVHKMHFLKLLLAFGAFAALSVFTGDKQHRWSLALRTGLLLSGMVLLCLSQWYMESTQAMRSSEPVLQTHVRGAIIPLAGELYVYDISFSDLTLGLTMLMLPFFCSRLARDDWAIYLVAATVAPLLLLYNPIVYPWLVKVLYQAARRFRQVIPVHLALGYLLWLAWQWAGALKDGTAAWATRSTRLVLVGAVLLVALLGLEAEQLGAYLLHRSRYMIDEPGPAIQAVAATVPADSVVLADLRTSARLPGYVPVYTAVWPPGQAGTGAPYGQDRVEALGKLFSPETDVETLLAMLNRYEVDYVLFDELEARADGLSERVYADHPALFPVVFNAEAERSAWGKSLRKVANPLASPPVQRYRITVYGVNPYEER